MLNTVLNVIWVILGGFMIWLQYAFGGLILCLTVIGIPFGLQCFKLAGLGLWPFGRVAIDDANSALSGGLVGLLMNIIWILTAGWMLLVTHISLAIGFAVTIIGIPFAIQHVKLAILGLMPFGKAIREI